MRRAKLIGRIVPLVLAVALSGAAGAQSTRKVKIRGVISPPKVTVPVNLSITVYPAEQDSQGSYLPPRGGIQNRTVRCDPASAGRPVDFELEFEVLKEYEVRVELLDDNGEPVKDGTYYFADIDSNHPEGRTPIRLDAAVPVPLTFRWESRSQNKGNFVSPVPGADGFVLTYYINPATVPGI
jgi:hypothetical protein